MILSVGLLPWVIGTVFNMGLGALWYSNVLFAKPWMVEADISQEDLADTSGMGAVYGLTMALAAVTSYMIGVVVANFGGDLGSALVASILIWLGADLPMIVKNWGFEGRTIKLGLINHGYQLVVYLFVGILHALL